jgi:hypothetical protein
MTVVKLSGIPEEVLGRPLVVLDSEFVQARYDQDSFAKIASRKRQLAFGVTLGLRGSALELPYVKAVLEGESAVAAVLKRGEKVSGAWSITPYTDVVPPRIALYLEPDVPDEVGEKARRLEELVATASEAKRYGIGTPLEMGEEFEELNRIWSNAKIFRKPIHRPGSLKVSVPTPFGTTVVSWKVLSGDQPLADTIEHLHVYLHVTLDVLLDLENAVRLRDAIVRARAEGNGEARLKTKRRSITIKAIFLQEKVAGT